MNIHITETAKIPDSFKKYYCLYEHKFFDTLEEIGTCDACMNCSMACDRKSYKWFTKHNLRGKHLLPINKDPICKVNMEYIPLDDSEKIKREIKEYDD